MSSTRYNCSQIKYLVNGENAVTLDHSLGLQQLHHSEVLQHQEGLPQFGLLRLVKRPIQTISGRLESLQAKTEREKQLSQFIVQDMTDLCYLFYTNIFCKMYF